MLCNEKSCINHVCWKSTKGTKKEEHIFCTVMNIEVSGVTDCNRLMDKETTLGLLMENGPFGDKRSESELPDDDPEDDPEDFDEEEANGKKDKGDPKRLEL